MPGCIQEIANPLMLLFDVVPATLELGITMVGGGVGKGREGIRARPIGGGQQDAIEFHAQVESTGDRRTHADEMKFGRHGATSFRRARAPNSLRGPYRDPFCVCARGIERISSSFQVVSRNSRSWGINSESCTGKLRAWPPATRMSWLGTPAAVNAAAMALDCLTGTRESRQPCTRSIGGSPGET